jgi:hypothetical protein
MSNNIPFGRKRVAEDMFSAEDPMVEEDDENTIGIRFKWLADSAETIDDIIGFLQNEIDWYKKLQQEGWELCGPVQDDYGFIRKKPMDHHVQEGPKKVKT